MALNRSFGDLFKADEKREMLFFQSRVRIYARVLSVQNTNVINMITGILNATVIILPF